MENQNNQNNEQNVMNEDYLKTIQDLKANTVSKESYDKMLEENRKLLNTIVQGKTVEVEQDEPNKKSSDELRDLIFNNELSNLEFCEATLQLRDQVMEETGEDIFVAHNSRYTPGADSYAAAERVASVMKECIEYANGDSQAFTNELMRRTTDVALPGIRK